MPRNGSGVFTLPAGSVVSNGDVSDASDINSPLADLEADMNTPRPIVAGGTGATNAADARSNLGIVSFPPGGIILWSGSIASIPSGWALCDGTNGTPNLEDRFVIGAGNTYAVAANGGSTTKTIAEANLPAHTHGAGTLATSSSGAHTHTFSGFNLDFTNVGPGGTSTGIGNTTLSTSSNGAHTHTISGATGSTGSGTALDIMPPYYALAYIMKL